MSLLYQSLYLMGVERCWHRKLKYSLIGGVPQYWRKFYFNQRGAQPLQNLLQETDGSQKMGIWKFQTMKTDVSRLVVFLVFRRRTYSTDVFWRLLSCPRGVKQMGYNTVGVFDMNGFQFLFEFPSRSLAEKVKLGQWSMQQATLDLSWWTEF